MLQHSASRKVALSKSVKFFAATIAFLLFSTNSFAGEDSCSVRNIVENNRPSTILFDISGKKLQPGAYRITISKTDRDRYKIVPKKDDDLYKITRNQNIYIMTSYCEEYAYERKVILEIRRSGPVDGNIHFSY
jgi:hypothetical protein